MHLEEDITATNEFTIEVYLWDGRPVGVVFYSLSEVGVLQDVVGAVVLHAVQPQDLHDGVAEAAEGLRRTALHKHHHRVLPHQSFHRFPRPRAAAIGPTTASSAAGGRLAQVSPPGSAPRRPDTQAQGRTQRPIERGRKGEKMGENGGKWEKMRKNGILWGDIGVIL